VERYRHLEHTSDLAVEIPGSDMPELFRNAAFAVFDNILNLDQVRPEQAQVVELDAATPEELLLDWLRELLFRFATGFFVVKDVPRLAITGTHLSAQLRGEEFDPQRHRVKIEIKTPTYHMYRLERTGTGLKATIVFDV
jgi:SHS2 domain-containing protein